jgi:hypothetical protein
MGFHIDEIVDGVCYGTDSYNRATQVPATLLPMKGPGPLPGETWLISKQTTGLWSLVSIINNPDPPAVVGTTTDPLLLALVVALDAAGHINFTNTALSTEISATSEVSS